MLTTDKRQLIADELAERWYEQDSLAPFILQLKNRPALAMKVAMTIRERHGKSAMEVFISYIAGNPALYDGDKA